MISVDETLRETGQSGQSTFMGEKTLWHGFDRYDFLMDEETLVVKQIKAAEDEKCETNQQVNTFHPVKGRRRCLVVVPKAAAPGNPWSWRGYYFGHETQTEVELLKHGFHICFIFSDPDALWDAWYSLLTEHYGLSKKPAFIGMSRGGSNAYRWGTANPDKVSCIYADNPGIRRDSLLQLDGLIKNDVPLLNVCGSIDPILGNATLVIEGIYRQLGGRIYVMIQEGLGHHPHSLRNPEPIVDFIVKNTNQVSVNAPAFVGEDFTKSCFYSIENTYRYAPSEKTYITYRGPWFNASYNCYDFRLYGNRISVITPNITAPGIPWVFRSDYVTRDAVVDLALLAKGFHIVTGPVPTNSNGPVLKEWDAVYEYLTHHGFSRKPVMEGGGAAAGEVYAWAIENPDKVSCIYGENPVLRSNLAITQPIDNLAPLAIAGVPILHVCGSLDPWFNDNTRVVVNRYQELGGKIKVIIKEGVGHYPLAPHDPKPVVDFICLST
jgi:pimeloyl-ACP methyl ester carboxylesterase